MTVGKSKIEGMPISEGNARAKGGPAGGCVTSVRRVQSFTDVDNPSTDGLKLVHGFQSFDPPSGNTSVGNWEEILADGLERRLAATSIAFS